MGNEPSQAVVPQYVKIASDIRDKIRDGTYGPGALLPSRNEISDLYGVSAITARDALSMISHEGLAKAVRGRGHIVRRKRARLTLPSRLYASAEPDSEVPLELSKLDIYQEQPPDNIALPLETAEASVWVRRAVFIAAGDRQPIQIHVSWLTGLTAAAERGLYDSTRTHHGRKQSSRSRAGPSPPYSSTPAPAARTPSRPTPSASPTPRSSLSLTSPPTTSADAPSSTPATPGPPTPPASATTTPAVSARDAEPRGTGAAPTCGDATARDHGYVRRGRLARALRDGDLQLHACRSAPHRARAPAGSPAARQRSQAARAIPESPPARGDPDHLLLPRPFRRCRIT